MKKIIFSLVCLVSVGNFALASSVDDIAVGTLEKQDSQAIFGNKEVGAVSLSQSEMRDTEGEFIWFLPYAYWMGRAGMLSPAIYRWGVSASGQTNINRVIR